MDVTSFSAVTLSGETIDFADYRGKVLLVVNTASECGFTSQYEGLQQLHEAYSDRGLVVLGFPCNQFGKQEPGSGEQIAQFCERSFGVSFPLFQKVDVNGEAAHPLYQWLKQQAPGLLGSTAVKWNFTKFLVARDASSVERFAPTVKPASLKSSIEHLLSE